MSAATTHSDRSLTRAPQLTHPSALWVHEDAIAANTAYFAALTGNRLMAVLKADSFGHGDLAKTVIAAGASAIGVATIAEALRVRASGVRAPLLS